MTDTVPAPDPYYVAAEILRDLAYELASLAGRGLTDPHVTVDVVPFGPYGDDEKSEATRVAVVDAVAEALGMVPKVQPMSSGSYHRNAERTWQHGRINVYTRVMPDEMRELRRRLAEAEAELAERYKTHPPFTPTASAPAGQELEQAAIPAEAMTRVVQPAPIHDPAEDTGWTDEATGLKSGAAPVFEHNDREAELARIAEETGEPIEIVRGMADAMAACTEEQEWD